MVSLLCGALCVRTRLNGVMYAAQALVKNEEAEEQELKAFHYSCRITLATSLHNARKASAAAAGTCAIDFLALADVIAVCVATDPAAFPAAAEACAASIVRTPPSILALCITPPPPPPGAPLLILSLHTRELTLVTLCDIGRPF